MSKVQGKGGRTPKADRRTHHVMLRFNEGEWLEFLAMQERAGIRAKAVFAKMRLFGEPFRVWTEDKNLVEYHAKLSSFHTQYRMVGNNYNQVVKELRCHFSERKAMALLYRLENCTKELALLTRRIIELTLKMEGVWSRKSV